MFKNLVTLVTGGAAGLGHATAQRLIDKGSKIVICDLPTSFGSEVARELGDNAHYIPADVKSESDIQNVVKEIAEKYGKLDVVVNCAGLANAYVTYNFNTKSPRNLVDFENIILTNVLGSFNVTRLAVGLMGKNEPDGNGLRGVIINTSSVEAFRGASGQVAIAAASGALHSMTKPLAEDFSERGIRVVTVAPGMIRTELCNQYPAETEECISQECLAAPRRLGYQDEFAHVVHSIIANPYINATTIEVSAGLNLHM